VPEPPKSFTGDGEQSRLAGSMLHFWCPVPVQVRTSTQTHRETYLDPFFGAAHQEASSVRINERPTDWVALDESSYQLPAVCPLPPAAVTG
jgi:hypothetical protein